MNRKQMVYCIISSLLQYPEEQWPFKELWEEIRLIPIKSIREPLMKFLVYLKDTPYQELCEKYIFAFEGPEQTLSSKYITYKSYKEKLERGEVPVQLLQEVHKNSIELGAGELPAYLPILLGVAAIAPEGQIDTILRLHKRTIDGLQLKFQGMNSPYRYLIEACMENLVVGDEPENQKVS